MIQTSICLLHNIDVGIYTKNEYRGRKTGHKNYTISGDIQNDVSVLVYIHPDYTITGCLIWMFLAELQGMRTILCHMYAHDDVS